MKPGDIIAGKYAIDRVLGEGGMGVVLAATHVELGRKVAIKILHAHASQSADVVARFQREARAAAKLTSDHVVQVVDVGTMADGSPYIIMEHLVGSDLSEVLAASGPFAADLLVALMTQACEAIGEAHANGIVHRDIKPSNLFLTRTSRSEPRLKVLDFGIAKLREHDSMSSTHTSAVLGTPLYMSPEQMTSSRDVDHRADIWSLGVVMFELVTGRPPFQAESIPGLAVKIMTMAPPSASSLRPDLSAHIAQAIDRCLAKSPDDRWQSVAELARALSTTAETSREALDVTIAASRQGVEQETPFHETTLACPPLDVRGIEEPTGWFGAAAAQALARRARWLFGGDDERVLFPATLAGLSHETPRTTQRSPFDDRATFDAAMRAASRNGSILTGVVERRRDRIAFHVHIEMGGRRCVNVEREGSSLHEAAREAILAIGDALGWAPLHASAEETYGTITPRVGVLLEDCMVTSGRPVASTTPFGLTDGGAFARSLAILRHECPHEVDPTSTATRAWTAHATVAAGGALTPEDHAALQRDLESARSPEARATFRALAALRAAREGNDEQAWKLALRAVSIDPRSTFAWDALLRVTPSARMTEAHAWWIMTWAPDTQIVVPNESAAAKEWGGELIRRGQILDPSDEVAAFHRGSYHVLACDLTAAESFAAELDDSSSMQRAAECVRALVDLRQARFGRGLARLTRVLDERGPFGHGIDRHALLYGLPTGDIVGRASQLADMVLQRALADRSSLDSSAQALDLVLLEGVSYASPMVARPALAQLRSFAESGLFEWPTDIFEPLSRAVEAMIDGRSGDIVAPIRPLATNIVASSLLARLFDAGGNTELATRVDDTVVANSNGSFGGISMAFVRSARRAARAGNVERARALAKQIVDAWSIADEDLAIVNEMRALL